MSGQQESVSNWRTEPLGALGSWVGGGTPSKSTPEFWVGGTIPWVSPKDVKAEILTSTGQRITEAALAQSAAKRFDAHSIAIVVRSGILEHTLPVTLVPFSAAANQDIRVLTPRPDINARWLLYALLGQASKIRQACWKQGTTVASIDVSRLMEYEISIPPQFVQAAITKQTEHLLGQLAAGSTELDSAIKSIAVLRDAGLRKVLGLDGRPLPHNWQVSSLTEVADLSAGGTPSRGRPEYFGGDIPWLKIGDLNEGVVTSAEESITQLGLEKSSAEVLEPGTVLLAMYGASIGRTGLLGIAAATNQAICAMKVNEQRVRAEYLHLLLRANRQRFVADGYGGAQPNISQRYLRAFRIPLPPVSIQELILGRAVEFEHQLAATASLVEGCGIQAQRLRAAVLRQAGGTCNGGSTVSNYQPNNC